jgi:DNA-binding NarL/FixJ family response regulator
MARKILIVDDREPLRRRMRSFLEHEGFEICGEAANGREAIERVKELAPDLAILNISMPIMNGLEALPVMLRSLPGMKVVIFTLDEAEELKQQAFRLGAHGFVTKSAPPDDLLAEVKRLLGQTKSSGVGEV